MTLFVGFVLVIGILLLVVGGILYHSAHDLFQIAVAMRMDVDEASKTLEARHEANQEMLAFANQRIGLKVKYLESINQEISDRMSGKDWSIPEED